MNRLLKIFTIFLVIFFLGLQPSYAAGKNQLIIINKTTNKLAFFENGALIKTFPVATGRRVSYTPEGKFKIVTKIKNRPYYKLGIPGGSPRNPLGDRWLGLNARGTWGNTYGIHGNNNPRSIGTYASAGCVRMYNRDVRWLFDRVAKYTTVFITRSKKSSQEIARSIGYQLGYKYFKGKANLVVYNSGSSTRKPIALLNKDQIFKIKDSTRKWHRIQLGNTVGYVWKKNVSPVYNKNLTQPKTNPAETKYLVTATSQAVVYKNPRVSKNWIVKIQKGQKFYLTAHGGGFFKVIYGSKVGYVLKKQTKIEQRYFKVTVDDTPIYQKRQGKLAQVGSVEKGQLFRLLGASNNWAVINIGKDLAYIQTRKIALTSKSGADQWVNQPANSIKRLQSRVDLKVYSTKDAKRLPVATLKKGQLYPVINLRDGWFRIELGGKLCYIFIPRNSTTTLVSTYGS